MAGQAEELRSPQRRAHERMTADQFVWWLRGYLAAAVVEKTKAAARATDDYVHDNPWKAVGVAAGVGFLLGLLVNRR